MRIIITQRNKLKIKELVLSHHDRASFLAFNSILRII
jgi:hypothetical protein